MAIAAVSDAVTPQRQASSLPFAIVTRWHLLSLDAPAVAVAWLLLLNHRAPAHEQLVEAGALALAVWCIYALDRLADAQSASARLHERHNFHARHRRVFLALLAAAMPLLALLVALLPAPVRCGWTMLGVPFVLYAAAVHLLGVKSVAKEVFVGLFFAIAVAVPVWGRQPGIAVAAQAGAFSLLCWWNCVAIAAWEAEQGWYSSAQQASRRFAAFAAMQAIVTGAVWLLVPSSGPVAAACVLAGLALTLLHRNRRRLGPLLLRSLADAALLTPLVILPFLAR